MNRDAEHLGQEETINCPTTAFAGGIFEHEVGSVEDGRSVCHGGPFFSEIEAADFVAHSVKQLRPIAQRTFDEKARCVGATLAGLESLLAHSSTGSKESSLASKLMIALFGGLTQSR